MVRESEHSEFPRLHLLVTGNLGGIRGPNTHVDKSIGPYKQLVAYSSKD
jgi:hypothetical protein